MTAPAAVEPVAQHRSWLTRIPLRIQLVVVLLLLTAIGLLLAGTAATTVLRGYLTDRLDESLQSTYGRVAQSVGGYLDDDPGRPPFVDPLFVSVHDADGTVIDERRLDVNDALGDPALPATLPDDVTGPDEPFTVEAVGSSSSWRVAAQRDPSGRVLFVAVSLGDVESTSRQLVVVQLLVGAGVLLVLGAVGYGVVRRSLAPLTEIEHVAEDIAAGDLARRVPEPNERTEVGRLAGALNGMLGRIETAVRDRESAAATAQESERRMRRFIADASHELRTPLTSIRGYSELYRQGAVPPGPESDRVMSRIESEAGRMNVLVEDLLLLARLDQSRPPADAPVDLVPLAVDAAYDARAVAPDREVRVDTAGLPHAVVRGDEVRLRQVLGNLVSNALTHTPAGTPVEIRLHAEPDGIVLEVADQGPGLTPEQMTKVFERFYRADTARSRAAGGSGLGLAIVDAIVASHGGRVEVQSAPGAGATFRIWLPSGGSESFSRPAAPHPPQVRPTPEGQPAQPGSYPDPR